MVRLSQDVLFALHALLRQLQPGLRTTRLASALAAFETSTATSPVEEWVTLRAALRETVAELSGSDAAKYAELVARAEDEMRSVVEQAEKGDAVGQISVESNGLLPPSPSSSSLPDEAATSSKEPSQPAPTSSSSPPLPLPDALHIPPALLPLLLGALSSEPKATLSSSALLTTLAIAPHLVLPPGKTIQSLFSQPRGNEEEVEAIRKRKRSGEGSLEDRISFMMRNAFWDDAEAKLLSSPPNPAVRLALLQRDLSTAFSGIIPPRILAELFVVPDQTAVWDRSAFTRTLVALLDAAKQRAAPIRDEDIEKLVGDLERARADPDQKTGTRAILRVVQETLDLAEVMKADLVNFQLLSIPPTSLPSLVQSLARSLEREEILSIYGPEEALRQSFLSWAGSGGADGWTQALVRTVCSANAVALPPSPSVVDSAGDLPPNTLPPILIGVSNILFRLQNQIQALVITSSLVALVPPSHSSTSSSTTTRSTLPQKIHALLTADLLAPASASHTHLSDLSSLVLRALPARPSDDQAEKLKSAISRVLRTEDPVWGLLLGRLAQALVTALDAPRSRVPTSMVTGRIAGKATGQATARETRMLVVKGFEGETMEQACGQVLVGLEAVKRWVEDVWREVVMKKV